MSRAMQLRMCLKPAEEKRVREALTLVTSQITENLDPKQKKHRDFLQHVLDIIGLYSVVISAAGLGISVVLRMKDLVRLEVPSKLKESENDIRCTVLENITDKFSSKCEL